VSGGRVDLKMVALGEWVWTKFSGASRDSETALHCISPTLDGARSRFQA
jgi:hypothetical protein